MMEVTSIKKDPAMDAEGFASVFDSHYVEVYRYLRRRVGSHLAEEMAAETFVVAFRERRRYDPAVAEIRPWLFGIAVNLMRRERRREARAAGICAQRRRSGRPGPLRGRPSHRRPP